MKKSHRTWLAVPPEEKDQASQAHPRLDNGQNAIVWDKEHKLWFARPGVELNKLERWLPRPHDISMNSDDPVIEFAQKLEDAGLVLKGLPVMDGSWKRVPTKNDKKGSKSGAYRGFLDGRPAGSYRDYRSADEKPIPWVYSGGNDMDPLARLHLRAHAQQTREDNARELEQQYNRQADYATRYVSRLPQATTAPYLTRKGVDAAPGVRINPKGELVIPFSNAQGQIRSYQRIPETGGKDARILKDSEKTGNWFAMGTPVNGQPILFAEGYATAASLHESSGLPVLMTIDAGNMIAVAQNARSVWPDSPFIFCADNDHQLKNPQTGEPENKGIISAGKAAALTQGQVMEPAFTLAELGLKLTDFNDLDVSRGRDTFHQEINVQLFAMGVVTPFTDTPKIREALTRAGIEFPPVQEPRMNKEETPDGAPTAGNELSPQPLMQEESPVLTTEQEQQAIQENPPPQSLAPDAATSSAPEVTPLTASTEPDTPEPVTASPEAAVIPPPSPAPADIVDLAPAQAHQHVAADASTLQPDTATAFTELEQDTPRILTMEEPVEFVLTAETENTGTHAMPSGQKVPEPTQPDLTAADATMTTEPAAQKQNSPVADTDTAQMAEAATTTSQTTVSPDAETTSQEETDSIVYGPRRPDAPAREDLDNIIKGLSWEMLKNNTQLFRLDGEDAFRDLGNRLEMCSGASQDDRKVLAALMTAAKFYGGVIELTGSPEFKENAMRLIITHDLEIRMKLPAQRTQLEEMRKQMGTSQDAVVTHMPTPDLNRQTPTGEPSTTPQTAVTPEQAPPADMPAGPQPQVPPEPGTSSTAAAADNPAAPQGNAPSTQAPSPTTADAVKVQETPEEPAPSALSPGQSVTAVLKNAGEATYENKEQRGHSFFIELENRSGSHIYWGQDLRKLVEHHRMGDVVTLTLNGRDSWTVPGEEKERVKNNWSLVSASTGIAVSHTRPEQGQQLLSFPVDTFGKLTQQIRQAWPDHMADLKLPSRFEDRLFYLGEDRHPVMAPQGAAGITPPGQAAPASPIPVMASMNSQSNQMDLLLVQSAGEHLQGVVRLNGTLYPALATPTTDSNQLVVNAITDQGPHFAGYGQAVNFEPDGTTRAAPQLMTFHLKGREEEPPLPARLYTPEKQDDALFQRLGFEQTWKQWDDARKPEDRQEKALHQEHSHSPGR